MARVFFHIAWALLCFCVCCAVRPEAEASSRRGGEDHTAIVVEGGHLLSVPSPAEPHRKDAAHPLEAAVIDESASAAVHSVDTAAAHTSSGSGHHRHRLAALENATISAQESLLQAHAAGETTRHRRNISALSEEDQEEERFQRQQAMDFLESMTWCRNFCVKCPNYKDARKPKGLDGPVIFIHRSQHLMGKLLSPLKFTLNVATLGIFDRISKGIFGKASAICPNVKLYWQAGSYGFVEFGAQLKYGTVFSYDNGLLEPLKFHEELWSEQYKPGFMKNLFKYGSNPEERKIVYKAVQDALEDMCAKAGEELPKTEFINDYGGENVKFHKMFPAPWQKDKCLHGKVFPKR